MAFLAELGREQWAALVQWAVRFVYFTLLGFLVVVLFVNHITSLLSISLNHSYSCKMVSFNWDIWIGLKLAAADSKSVNGLF